MKSTCLYILLCVVLAFCSSSTEAVSQEPSVERSDTIKKIAGYDVSHLDLLAGDFDLPYQKISGRMLLWIAAEYCDTTLFFQVLRQEENPAYTFDGDHILTEVAFCDEAEALLMAKALLAKGVDVISRCNNDRTLLHFTAKEGLPKLAKYLLDNKLIDPSLQDTQGETALQYADKYRSPEVASLLQ